MPISNRIARNAAEASAALKAGQLEGYMLARSTTAEDSRSQRSWGPSNRI